MSKPSVARPWGDSAPRAERHPIDLSARLGSAVRRLRDQQGVSQEELADRAQLDRTFISMLERGKRRATLESAQAIAAALGLSFSELVREFEPSPDEPGA
ncbi:helix-turn-helix domain-containing protein [Deinococcus aetherius]|uniref:helix-turn-helix domain-containing protein n=1 Tax=Deinococcus aetherius TaxID=200252 RepID=UPI00222FA9EF|nr:helix-turn-helix transcriptional regulator [Deinococcus aetherius]